MNVETNVEYTNIKIDEYYDYFPQGQDEYCLTICSQISRQIVAIINFFNSDHHSNYFPIFVSIITIFTMRSEQNLALVIFLVRYLFILK